MIAVMQEVKSIDKDLTVGTGSYSYKGVADKDVKQAIGQAMAKNGLTCVPIKIEPTTTVDRWTETYKGNEKTKTSVFVEVLVTFRISHDSGESVEIMGYGHGQDSNDKAAGKATTYALKNALLYSFLVPTGSIDDTDNTHSNEAQTPTKQKPKLTDDRFAKALEAVKTGSFDPAELEEKYELTENQVEQLNKLLA